MRTFPLVIAIGIASQVYGLTLADLHPLEIRKFAAQGQYPAAIRVCDEIIGYWRDVGTRPPQDAFDANYAFSIGYYLLAKAQLFALSGDVDRADHAVMDAENSFIPRGGTEPGMLDAPWKSMVNITRGFIEEKKGNMQQALTAYRDADSEIAYGRLAVLSVRSGRISEAKVFVAKDPDSPTSLFVLGKIAANSGNRAEANRHFVDACRKLQAVVDGKSDANEFMPIFVCEAENIRSACASTPPGR